MELAAAAELDRRGLTSIERDEIVGERRGIELFRVRNYFSQL
eukprot:COSAG02_NODE_55659_length_289_cov_0.821053_1_plen_41_part_10